LGSKVPQAGFVQSDLGFTSGNGDQLLRFANGGLSLTKRMSSTALGVVLERALLAARPSKSVKASSIAIVWHCYLVRTFTVQ